MSRKRQEGTGKQTVEGNKNTPKDTEELIDFRITVEKRRLGHHFSKDSTNAPDVHRASIALRAEENLRCSVPKRNNLAEKEREERERERLYNKGKTARQKKTKKKKKKEISRFD